MKTQATMSSLRVNEFLKAEQRNRHSTGQEDWQLLSRLQANTEAVDSETPSLKQTPPIPKNDTPANAEKVDSEEYDNVFCEDRSTLLRSATPSLPHPSTIDLIDSNDFQEQDIYTPVESSDEEIGDSQSKASPSSATPFPSNSAQFTTDVTDGKPTTIQSKPGIELEAVADLPPKAEVEMIPVTGIEESCDYSYELTGNIKLIPADQLPTTLETVTPATREKSVESQAASGAKKGPVIHHLEDLKESKDSDLYDAIESPVAKKHSTMNAVEKHRVSGIDVQSDKSLSLDGYNDPVELDAVQRARREDEGNVHLLQGQGREEEEASPYEDPTTLDNSGEHVYSVLCLCATCVCVVLNVCSTVCMCVAPCACVLGASYL